MADDVFRPGDPIIEGIRHVRGAETRVSPGGDRISVQIKGLPELRAAMNNLGRLAEEAARQANVGVAFEALTDVRERLKAKPDDTGDLASRYHVEYAEKDGRRVSRGKQAGEDFEDVRPTSPVSAILGARSDHAAPVEFGRRAGAKPPPPGVLKDWLKRHGLPESWDYPLAQAIARRGIQPYPHLTPSVEEKRARHEQLHARFLKEAADKVSRASNR